MAQTTRTYTKINQVKTDATEVKITFFETGKEPLHLAKYAQVESMNRQLCEFNNQEITLDLQMAFIRSVVST